MLSQRSLVAKGMLASFLKPRLARGVALPTMALDAAARHLGKRGFDNAEAATAIRKAGAGLLAPDADLDDLPEFLAAAREILARENDTEATDQEQPMDAQQVIDEIKRLILSLPGEEQEEVVKRLADLAADFETGSVEGDDAENEPFHHRSPPPREGEDVRRRRHANDLALDAALRRYESARPAAAALPRGIKPAAERYGMSHIKRDF